MSIVTQNSDFGNFCKFDSALTFEYSAAKLLKGLIDVQIHSGLVSYINQTHDLHKLALTFENFQKKSDRLTLFTFSHEILVVCVECK